MKPKLYVKIGNQDEFDVSERIPGLKFLGETISPQPTGNYQDNAGRDGSILTSLTYAKNTINSNFGLRFKDYYELELAKHEIYSLFASRNVLRTRTDAKPSIVKYVTATPFDLTPLEDYYGYSKFTIPFDNSAGVLFSLARSDQLDTISNGKQLGMNLPNGDTPNYHYTSSTFNIYNASDIKIQPYEQHHDLRIIIHFAGTNLKITNKTNGTSWSYTHSAAKSDEIILDGINTTLNGNPASANTDFGNIDLEVGTNSISVTGATDIDITFSFPFMYLA
ncbi:phage tail domain-containing protein [Paucilactobacillus sp. N302-9]